MKNLGNSNVNINDNKNNNVNIASLLSELFGDQEDEFPCTIGDLCYDKKKTLIKSGAAAVDAKKAVEPTEKAVESSAAPAAAPVAIPAVAPAADVNFDQFSNFADFQDDDVIFAVPSEMDEGDDDFFA
ncbi:hypothetical protein DAPPUDRAFT_103372 [Daphnia pulex]|uniref:Uncharacterized protein n=1 Tax=Daphnia pulex TaxID=6669 RepID=E9GJ54_DAPPU|nr:hypothetical protein DAPPUDRAFT_103372 [Daphnia pulex]|eukprot:EFX80387.1 hypothetical protein DAPPUDRAFT_103372 [Daphnia pulex]